MAINSVPTWDDSEPMTEEEMQAFVSPAAEPKAIEAAPVEAAETQAAAEQGIAAGQTPTWEDSEPMTTSMEHEDVEQFRNETMPGILGMLGFDFNPFEEFAKGGVPGVISTAIAGEYEKTPEEVSTADAFMFTSTHMMTDVMRGIKQIAGIDEEEMRERQATFNKIMEDPRYEGWATAGAVAGALAEPVGLLVPGMKSKTILQTAAKGSGIGGAFGTLGYVDEEAGRTRIENGLIGMTMGGIVGGTAKATSTVAPEIGRAVSETKPFKAIAKRKAHKFLDDYEMEWAKLIAEGKSPQEARKYLLAIDPKMGTKVGNAFRETNRVPHTLLTQSEAQQVVDMQKKLTKPLDVVLGTVTDPVGALFRGMDTVGGAVATRIRKISEPVFGRLRQYEFNIRYRPHEYLKRTEDFTEQLKQLSPGTQERVNAYLINGEWNKVTRVLKDEFGDEGMLAVQQVRDVLKEIGLELRKHRRLDSLLDNYFPRYIVDQDGLLKGMGKETFKTIRADIEKAAIKKKAPLSPLESANIINKKILRPVSAMEGGPGLTKQRGFDQVPGEFMQFYAKPSEALHTYLNNAIIDIEKAKFFGKGFTKVKGENFVDVATSVGGFLEKELADKNLSQADINELTHLLNIRFGIGESSPMRAIQGTKNYLYASLLGNPISAVTQTGDVGVSVYANGMVNTVDALQETLTGRTLVKVKDLGLVDKLNEEFASTTSSAKFLNKALRAGGFEAVDRMGKSTIINSSLKKHMNVFDPNSKLSAKARAKVQAEFAQKYEGIFGKEYGNLVQDLRNGKITENVKLLLFNDLADLQPIALSEMTEAYLRMPNGRVLYMFKTFILKQLDIIRRDAIQEMMKGTKEGVGKGAWTLLKYGAVIGSANTGSQYVKDFIMGRDIEPTPTDVPMNFLKTLGWSEYTQNKIAEGKPIEATIDLVTPPYKIVDDILQNPEDSVKYMPVAGRFIQNWFMGGLEDYNEKHGKSSVFGGDN